MLLEPAFERLAAALGQDRGAPLWRGVAVARTCLLVVVGMTLFRADTLADFGQMVASVFAGSGIEPLASGALFTHGCDVLDLWVALAGAAAMLAFDLLQRRPGGVSGLVLDHGTPLKWAAGVGLLCAVVVFGAYGVGYTPVASIYAGF
jgi:alginate O-acetyltransferase complex protein AlgI